MGHVKPQQPPSVGKVELPAQPSVDADVGREILRRLDELELLLRRALANGVG